MIITQNFPQTQMNLKFRYNGPLHELAHKTRTTVKKWYF
jgi:hypothetical protein